MAGLARADLVDPAEVAVFHCFHRCVRRSYLCGDDPYTGRNYDYREAWLEERLKLLASAFGIDLVGFAIMSNRFHVVRRAKDGPPRGRSHFSTKRLQYFGCPENPSSIAR